MADENDRVDPKEVLTQCDLLPPIRVGLNVGRTLYKGDGPDDLIGVMDTRELAAFVAFARTALPLLAQRVLELEQERDAGWRAVGRERESTEPMERRITELEQQLADTKKLLQESFDCMGGDADNWVVELRSKIKILLESK